VPSPRRGAAGPVGPLPNFHALAADDATTALIINVITAVGQFQRDPRNELTAEGIAAAEAQGRYCGRPPALTGARLEEVRSVFRDQGTSMTKAPRSRLWRVRTESAGLPSETALDGLLPDQHKAHQ
jgi:DNA invertase Pin-like site-specific DNA recombinase